MEMILLKITAVIGLIVSSILTAAQAVAVGQSKSFTPGDAYMFANTGSGVIIALVLLLS